MFKFGFKFKVVFNELECFLVEGSSYGLWLVIYLALVEDVGVECFFLLLFWVI